MTRLISRTTGNKPSDTPSNPLGEIINLIPWELHVIDAEMLDNIRVIVTKQDRRNWYSNKYVMLLLAYLTDLGFFQMVEVDQTQAGIPGRVVIIRRIKDGWQTE